MTKRLAVFLCLLFVTGSALAGTSWIVRFDASPQSFANAVSRAGGTIDWKHDGAGVAAVSGLDAAGATALGKAKGVVAVESDFRVTVNARPVGIDVALGTLPPHALSATDPTTADRYFRQWHLRAIGAQYAWAAGRLGSPSVTVAVIDSGIGYEHPDLAGLVDLSRSVSFAPSDDALVAANFPGKHPVTDLHYHGTHVAATIASNAILAAGVTTRVTLFGVKVLDVTNTGSFSRILRGVLWAVDHGADVANMSIGGVSDKKGNGRPLASTLRVFDYAWRHGTLIVAGAGNESDDFDHDGSYFREYCSATNVVCVSATGPTAGGLNGPWTDVDAFASYSNFGRSEISVAAPGGTLEGAVVAACSPTSLIYPVCSNNTTLLRAIGTSMAAPHVSGLAALIVEDIGHGNPAAVKARLIQSADDLGQPGTDPYYGRGRINVKRALGLE